MSDNMDAWVDLGNPKHTTEREAFEAWVNKNRPDLDLRYMYDEQGQYHYDGYILEDTSNAFRIWQASAERKDKRIAELTALLRRVAQENEAAGPVDLPDDLANDINEAMR